MDQTNVTTTELSNLTDSLAANTAPSFAVGGIVTTDVAKYAFGSGLGDSVSVQADGKILLGGGSYNGGGYDFALVRYNPDGSLDVSFDSDGKVTTEFLRSESIGNSVSVQADGKILLGGSGGGNFALVRYNPDGSLDTSFDSDGKVTTVGGVGRSVAVQADGKILLGGYSGSYPNRDFTLVRYNSDGSLDLSFDSDGIVTTSAGYDSNGQSITMQADGKILLGGTSNGNFALVRYNNDGSLDLSFGGDGKVTTGLGNDDVAYSVALQADGKILLGGTSDANFALVRYNSNGSLDTSFSDDGKVTTNLGRSDYGYSLTDYGKSVTVQADGKILLGGTSDNNFALVRYNSDGSLDLSFGGNGIIITDLADYDEGFSVAVQADGKILLGGRSEGNFALVRYNPDGSLDNSFAPNPVSTLNGKPGYAENSKAIVLDNTVQIYDAELAAQGNYNGASITLARHGGANAEDVFSGSGLLSFSGNDAVLSGTTLGTVSNSNGTLSIIFNSDASPARVDAVLSSIAYRNTTDNPPVPSDTPASVQIDWVFNDGNSGAQGTGEALTTTGSSIITILANHNEVVGTTGNDSIGVGYYSTKIYGFAGNDYLRGWRGNNRLDGGEGNDRLDGVRGDDRLYGSEGNDTLDGGAGADSMMGGSGDDLYIVGKGGDVVIENLDEGTDTIIYSRTYNLPANVENLTLTGTESIDGKGNDLANMLIGNDHDNRLSGGAGADTLSGGLGADIFKFNTDVETGITETTRDSIVDFSHDQGDKINLAAIDANTALKGDNAFAAPTVGGAFSGSFANPGELYFDQTTNILYGNNDADSTADFSIMVMGISTLAAADFVL